MGSTTVVFTGRRTGMTSIFLPGHGLVTAGDQLSVDEATAARWTALLPAAGGPAADFDLVMPEPSPSDETQPSEAPPPEEPEPEEEPAPDPIQEDTAPTADPEQEGVTDG